jgi:hypothetical protein
MDVDWFRLSTLEFIISHFRCVITNKVVARIRVPVFQIPLGTPYTVPVTYLNPDHPPAEFTFQIDIEPHHPLPRIRPILTHNRLYVYATYDPPIPLTSAPLPVTFVCVNTRDSGPRFSVFDEFVHWQSIGKGSHGLLSFGPTGPTHVAYLNRDKCDKSTSAFIVQSHAYQGLVTLNFLLAERARGFLGDRSLPRKEWKGLLLQSSVEVSPGSLVCLRHCIRIVGERYTVRVLGYVPPPCALPSLPHSICSSPFLTPGGDCAGFIHRIAQVIAPDAVLRRRRVLLPSALPFSLTAAASLVGLPAPHRVTIMGSHTPLPPARGRSGDHCYADFYLLAFDRAGHFVCQHDMRYRTPACRSLHGAVVGGYAMDHRPGGYYSDNRCALVDLDALLAQGVFSLAVTMLNPKGWALNNYRRKGVRILETRSMIEIGVYHVAAPWVGNGWGMLVGGIVFANDCWSWVPAGEMVKNQDAAGFHACWSQSLLKFQGAPPT